MKRVIFLGLAGSALIATSALAADLPVPASAPAYQPPPYRVPPVEVWNSCYVGATAGGVEARSNFAWAPNPPGFPVSGADLAAAGTGNGTTAGFTGGGEVGCNYQTGMFLLGGEADIEYTGINVTRNVVSPIFGVPISESTTSNWLNTYRGRLGIASGVWLFYATGGLALGQFNIADTATFAGTGTVNTITTTNTKLGWTVGGGAEWMFAPQWSLKAEYLYVDLGSETATSVNNNPALFPSSSIIHTHSLTENIGRVGVNFHF